MGATLVAMLIYLCAAKYWPVMCKMMDAETKRNNDRLACHVQTKPDSVGGR